MLKDVLPYIGQRRWRMSMAVLMGCFVMPAAAQVTYNAFPAVPQPESANGQPTPHHAPRVTLQVQDSTRGYALLEIARQAHVHLAFNSTDSVFAKRITMHVTDASSADAFAAVLRGTGFAVTMAPDGETAVIRPRVSAAAATQAPGGTIHGRVTDSASGRGLRGATVKVDGTKISATTSDSGTFTLRDVPAGDRILTARLFGYRAGLQTVTVVDSEPITIHFVLASVPTVLSGVVTTATGTQRKIEVGNDITTLNVDSVLRVAPVQTVTDLLETRVPGLTVVHSSGAPGDPSRLRLRGAGSIQLNNDPIVVVDGVRVYASQSDKRNANNARSQSGAIPNGSQAGGASYAAPSPLDQIDPNSIATIEVLKGPSATAIYGSDAASGVIVITTKRGRSGPTHWNVGLADGATWLPGEWPTNYYRFGYNQYNKGPFCLWDDASCVVDSVVAFQALNKQQYTVLDHGNTQEANLTVSGGVSTLTYSLTGSTTGNLGYLKLPGSEVHLYDSLYGPIPHALIRPDRYNTWGVNGSLEADPTPTVRVTVQSSLLNSTQRHSGLDNFAITQLSGTYLSPAILVGRPLLTKEYEQATADALTATNILMLHWQPRPWLPLEGTVGVNTAQTTDVTYVPYKVDNVGSISFDGSYIPGNDTTGSYGLARGTSRNETGRVNTTIPMFNQRVTLGLGGDFYSVATTDFGAYSSLLAPGVKAPTSFQRLCDGTGVAGPCDNPTTQSTVSSSTYGWFLEPRLNFASKFYMAPGFRLDGGSGGTKSTTSGGSAGGLGFLSLFPKMDFSYVAVDQQGDRPLWGVLTQLRPRLAFGVGGTQPSPADKLRLYNVGGFNIQPPGEGTLIGATGCGSLITLDGTTTVPAVCLSTLGNTNLRPERSREVEGGVDATLWRGRLTLIYTQYNKTRTDALLSIPVAQSVAGNAFNIQKNIGMIRNTGTEIQVNATVLESRSIGWTVGGQFSHDANLVVRLNKGQLPIVLSTGIGSPVSQESRVEAGYPLFAVFARPIVSYNDANQNGILDASEIRYGDSLVYVGQPDPKSQFTFTNNVTLLGGRLSVNTEFSYQSGLTQFNQGACESGSFQLLPNRPNTPLSTQAAVVAAACNSADKASLIGLVQVVNTFRFETLSINYDVPRTMASWFRVPRMSIALQGKNLGLHTNYHGFDPNVNALSTASAGDQTLDTGQLPLPRSWLLNLRLGN